MFYIPKHFKPEEVVSRKVYNRLKALGRLNHVWALFDPRILMTFDRLREAYGEPITINDWYIKGGVLQQCGLRMDDTDQGSEFGQHKFGRAGDLHFAKTKAEKIREDCLNRPFDPCFEFITCLEEDVSWFHCDCRNWDKAAMGILIVKP